ncbi:FKBP62 [Symbiodinium natans]|uniref:peptidylprolyl isomerase n=1 Tax=Symbiodinium natans TaxID=878477 RepID=A0A812JLH6_9DINO|nr:FKBP62 [Symbiodinium natans]
MSSFPATAPFKLPAGSRWGVELEPSEVDDENEAFPFATTALSFAPPTGAEGPRLPWGIRKTLLQEGSSQDHPTSGDEVRIHFDVRLLDGTAIGSSRDTKPFEFIVNQRPLEVIQGLEIAVQTMKKGEVAEFTVAPRFAYDDLGSPPLVPPDATLVFEIELLDWENKLDVLGDGRAIKTILEKGTPGTLGTLGSARPQRGQDVVVSVTITSRKGDVLLERSKLDHTVGSKDFGTVSGIITEVLLTMSEGERCQVLLRRFAGDKMVDSTHSGATVDLLLERVYVALDLLPELSEQGGLLVKKLVTAGSEDPPQDADLVALRVDRVLVGPSAKVHVLDKVLNFPLGSGDVCDALDFAAASMRVGEEAKLVCRSPLNFSDAQLGLTGLTSDFALEATFEVKLLSVARQANAANAALPLDERLQLAERRKDIATNSFKEGRYCFALELYRRLAEAL